MNPLRSAVPSKILLSVAGGMLICGSCASRLHPALFRVVPATPSYFLRSPDSRRTPFPEILRTYNGFEPGRQWIDLRPEMELRIENAYYRPGMSRRGLDGFLGTEIVRYKLGPRGGLQLLSVQSMKDRPSNEPAVQQLIHPAEMRDRRYRFYYELFFRSSRTARTSVLLGAKRDDQIDRLSARLVSDPDSVCGEGSRDCTVFPEACSVSIEMQIAVNGAPQNVVWGSLLSSVVEDPHQVEVWRLYKGRLVPVKLDAHDANALRLPLLPGDHVNWN